MNQPLMESETRASEGRYKRLLASITDYIYTVQVAEGRPVRTEHALNSETVTGYSPDEYAADPMLWIRMVHEEDRDSVVEHGRKALAGETPPPLEHRILHKDGSVHWIRHIIVPCKDPGGHLIGYDGLVSDITERKRAEETLRANEKRLAELNVLQGLLLRPNSIEQKLKLVTESLVRIIGADFARIWIIKPCDSKATCAHNQTAEGPHGCPFPEQCLHLVASSGRYSHIHGNHRRVPLGCYKIGKIAAGEEPKFLTNNVTSDPRVHNHAWARELGLVSFAGYRLMDIDGAPLGVMALFSKQKIMAEEDLLLEGIAHVTSQALHSAQADAALRQSEEHFRQLAEQSSEAIWFVSVNPERILYVNPVMEKVWGLPAESFYQDARVWTKAIHPEDQPRFHKAWEACLQGRSPRFEAEYRVSQPDGSIRWVLDGGMPIRDTDGKIVRLSGVARDITERKQIESQMLRTQRLESIGTLASGVAHDLNNALAPVIMATEMLHLTLPATSDSASHYLEIIRAGAKRGTGMVKQLLTFAKGADGERLLVQPKHLLKEMENLINSTFPKNIELQTNYAKDLRTILGDITQLHQVLLNLCVNARDAMPGGGTLTLEAENKEIDASHGNGVPEARPGSYVVWRVKDTGTGIPPEILPHIFDPFFTTKGPVNGTGLGLSIVVGIVKGHGGFIQVQSTPGQGSVFTVYLPAYGADASVTVRLAEADAGFQGNGETILVVDDDASVRNILRDVLTKWNFNVLTAADGAAALVHMTEKREVLRTIITDLHMPNMNGLAFARVIKGWSPNVRIIVISGLLENRDTNEFENLGIPTLLSKPFSQRDLADALKAVFQGVTK